MLFGFLDGEQRLPGELTAIALPGRHEAEGRASPAGCTGISGGRGRRRRRAGMATIG